MSATFAARVSLTFVRGSKRVSPRRRVAIGRHQFGTEKHTKQPITLITPARDIYTTRLVT